MALSSGPVALATFRDRIDATDARMDRQIADYRKSVVSGQQRDVLLQFTVWWQAYRNYRDHRLMVLARTDPVAFQTAYLGQAQLVTGRAMAALATLLRYEQTNGRHAAEAARSTYRTALSVMITTLVVGLSAALLLARRLAQLIVRPVHLVAEVLAAVAGGDLTREAHVDQRDELGQMARALSIATYSMREGVETLHAQQEMLQHAAFSDGLTGLPNRTYFLDRIEEAIARVGRQPEYRFAVLLLDLDGFKIVNDSLGHMVGDELLNEVARRIKASLRQHDLASRFGGDEFAVLIDGTDGDQPRQVAERMQAALCAPVHLAGNDIVVSASIGIAVSTAGYPSAEDVIRDADIAMYSAKSREKGTHAVFDAAMHARVVDRMQTEAQLRQALERNELEVYYQPIIDLHTGGPAGFEALIRWRHPDRGLLLPGDFLAVAEESGLILPIGRWLLDVASRQLQRWRGEHAASDLRMSINVSHRQFWRGCLLEDLDEVLRTTGLDPRSLVIEVTESVVMHDVKLARITLDRLHEIGVGLHIDDFGTGYSSLEALHHLRIDALKIDRSFVTALGVDRKGEELTRTIVVMGSNLGLDLVAEGIETAEQLDHLRLLGCGYGQGYWFSRPLAAGDADRFLRADGHLLVNRG
jgi:diguanylate cyclase (GGDEF)-like protein